jgi:superfamily I DNA/RNA helicase
LAGAGTGKTRVLTTRFAYLLLTGRAYPNQVLAVTFTNKAAREMRERVGAILGRPVEGLWLGTFHTLCARMLRRHAEHVGLTPQFTILDADDQLRLLKQIMEMEQVDTKRWAPRALMVVIQRTHNTAGRHRLRRRPRARSLFRLSGPAARAERGRLRRSVVAHDRVVARSTGHPCAIPPDVSLHYGR